MFKTKLIFTLNDSRICYLYVEEENLHSNYHSKTLKNVYTLAAQFGKQTIFGLSIGMDTVV